MGFSVYGKRIARGTSFLKDGKSWIKTSEKRNNEEEDLNYQKDVYISLVHKVELKDGTEM